MKDEITPKERKLVQLVLQGKSKAQAYIGAGYKASTSASASSMACRTLKKPRVQGYLQSLQQSEDNFYVLSRRQILAKLAEAIENCENESNLVKLSHEYNLMEGNHSPSKYADVSDTEATLSDIVGSMQSAKVDALMKRIEELESINKIANTTSKDSKPDINTATDDSLLGHSLGVSTD